MSQRIDVIIFGASGYCGKEVVQELYEIAEKEGHQITWGIAGRSLSKLKDVLRELELKTGKHFDKVPVLEADAQNETSLIEMASKARLIINCSAPYKSHGELVLRTCIQQNCHYVDISAEPQFMERMQLLYNEEAATKNVYVVTACGFDCIPAEMGLHFLQNNFNGTLNAVECYQELVPENGLIAGPILNLGSWESLLSVLVDYPELKKIRRKLFEKDIPTLEPKLSIRRFPHQIPMSKNIAGPYPGCEATVMRRSQRYFYENNGSRPVQNHTYLGSNSFLSYIFMFLGYLFLLFMTKFKFTLNLLLKYPRIFTGGFLGWLPNEEDRHKVNFVTTLYGRGWKGKCVDATYRQPEDSWIVAKVSGSDVYKATAVCAAISALVLLDSTQKLPKKGGVFTTVPVFSGTGFIEMLRRNGTTFDICGQGDL